MDLIECSKCQKKYALKLEKIPRVLRKWKCSSCQEVSSFPYYSEKEQEFLMNIQTTCLECKKQYSIKSNKFIAPKMKVICSICKNKYFITFSNFKNIQQLNQKISLYLNGNKKKNEIFGEDKNKFQSLIKEVIPNVQQEQRIVNQQKSVNIQGEQDNFFNTKNEEQKIKISSEVNTELEIFDDWENKIKQQRGMIPQDVRANFFLNDSKNVNQNKEEKLDISMPSLLTSKKEKAPKKNIKVGVFIFTLFFLIVIIYIYFIKFL